MRILIYGATVVALFSTGCKEESANTGGPSLYEKGRVIYMSRCTACHNMDPHLQGALGPDVYGSSLELIEARVLRAEYPPGYAPKRGTKIMVALPDLKNDIPALYAYLNDKK
jgi:mono/diheme cytochrome c family protein